MVREVLTTQGLVVTPQELAKAFAGARVERVADLLETLVSLGQAREVGAGRYAV